MEKNNKNNSICADQAEKIKYAEVFQFSNFAKRMARQQGNPITQNKNTNSLADDLVK